MSLIEKAEAFLKKTLQAKTRPFFFVLDEKYLQCLSDIGCSKACLLVSKKNSPYTACFPNNIEQELFKEFSIEHEALCGIMQEWGCVTVLNQNQTALFDCLLCGSIAEMYLYPLEEDFSVIIAAVKGLQNETSIFDNKKIENVLNSFLPLYNKHKDIILKSYCVFKNLDTGALNNSVFERKFCTSFLEKAGYEAYDLIKSSLNKGLLVNIFHLYFDVSRLKVILETENTFDRLCFLFAGLVCRLAGCYNLCFFDGGFSADLCIFSSNAIDGDLYLSHFFQAVTEFYGENITNQLNADIVKTSSEYGEISAYFSLENAL